jgi:hypothetical protein
MARHYTDVVDEEDRKASDHVGRLLDSEAAPHEAHAPASAPAAV